MSFTIFIILSKIYNHKRERFLKSKIRAKNGFSTDCSFLKSSLAQIVRNLDYVLDFNVPYNIYHPLKELGSLAANIFEVEN